MGFDIIDGNGKSVTKEFKKALEKDFKKMKSFKAYDGEPDEKKIMEWFADIVATHNSADRWLKLIKILSESKTEEEVIEKFENQLAIISELYPRNKINEEVNL